MAGRKAEARRLFAAGLDHADARRWALAADCFERAAALHPTPAIHYNLSTALVQMGDLVRAADLLRQIESAPDGSAEVRQAAHSQLQDVRRRLALLRVEVPGDRSDPAAPAHAQLLRARLFIDGQPIDRTRWGDFLAMNPTSHDIELRSAAAVLASRQVRLREGEQRTVDLSPEAPAASLPDLAAAAEPPASPHQPARHTWAWVALGAVVVGVTTAALIASRPDAQPSGNAGTWTLGGQ